MSKGLEDDSLFSPVGSFVERIQAYETLSSELVSQADRSWSELVREIDNTRNFKVEVSGETCHIQINMRWANDEHSRIKIAGCIYGPSWWNLERLEERVFVNRPSTSGGKASG